MVSVLALQQDMFIYENNKEVQSPAFQVFTWQENVLFADLYLNALASLVESGIFIYRQQIEITLKYKNTFLKYLQTSGSTDFTTVNIFKLASIIAYKEKYPKVAPVVRDQSVSFQREKLNFQISENKISASAFCSVAVLFAGNVTLRDNICG